MTTQVFDHVTAVAVGPGGSQTWAVSGKTIVVAASARAKVVIKPVGDYPPEDQLVVFLEGGHFKYEGAEAREYSVTLKNWELNSAQDLYVTGY